MFPPNRVLRLCLALVLFAAAAPGCDQPDGTPAPPTTPPPSPPPKTPTPPPPAPTTPPKAMSAGGPVTGVAGVTVCA